MRFRGISDADREALDVAGMLIAAGVPVFAAPPVLGSDDLRESTEGCGGYRLPEGWQKTVPDPRWLDPDEPGFANKAWCTGWALAAVMGHGLDLLDVDPRSGGDVSRRHLVGEGLWPRVYGMARTPSGGTHEFIAPLHLGSLDGYQPGLDYKGGRTDGTGRGFAFIAPTVRESKTTRQMSTYEWVQKPELSAIADGRDDSGRRLAEVIRPGKVPEREPVAAASPTPALKSDTPVPEGQRRAHILSRAGYLRDQGCDQEEATKILIREWSRCQQPPQASHEFSWAEAVETMADVYSRYAASRLWAPGHALPDQADFDPELAGEPALASLVAQIELREKAQLIVRDRRERLHPKPAPDAGSLDELLARPASSRWRIDGVLPAQGRMLWSAQRKAGKTTATGNLARSLLTGEDFLGKFPVEKIDGRVIALNYEVDSQQYARWMKDIGVPGDRLFVVTLRGRQNLLASAEGRQKLVQMIQEQDGQVLIVDTFGRAFNGKNQNDSAEVTAWLVLVDEIAEEAGCSEVILTAHAGWAGDRTRGSSALEDWPDVIVTMTRPDKDADDRYIRALGRDVDVAEDRLEYDSATRRLTLSGDGSRKGVQADAHLLELAQAIRELARATPGIRINVSGLGTALRASGRSFQHGDVGKAAKLAEHRGWVRHEDGPRNAKNYFSSE